MFRVKIKLYHYLRNLGPLLVIVVLLLQNSCVTTKKSTYLQEYKKSPYSGEYSPPVDYLIKPNDNLYIRVSTPDPRWSEIFNPSQGTGGMSMGGDASTQIMSYPVQLDGSVALPYIGQILVAGKTIIGAKASIEAVLEDYVSDASVSVRLVENYVTVLGEVNGPGMYPMTKDRLNVFQAIALAGDLADFSNRRELSLIRQNENGSTIYEFDLTDKNLVDSELYYIQPNDIIYVKPMKGKFFGMTSYPYGMLLGIVTAAVSLFILIQNQLILQAQ